MLPNFRCRVPPTVERLKGNKSDIQFIQTVLAEDRKVKELHNQQIQLTAENPRIRLQNETTDISAELRAQKHESILESKRRQQLRENNEELRQLEIQLRSAYVSQQLVNQKAHHEELKRKELEEKRKDNERNELELKKNKEILQELEAKERRKKEVFRGVLHEQMQETQAKRMREYEQVMQDRQDMQDTLQRLQAEHEKELNELKMRKDRSAKEMKEFVEEQRLHKLKAHSEMLDENEKFIEMRQKRDDEEAQRKARKLDELHTKQALSERIGKELYENETEKRRREDFLLDLLVEESKAKDDLRHKQSLEKQQQERLQIRQELESYRDVILRSKMEFAKEEEQRHYEEQMKILAENDKIEQLSQERRRRKVQEHRKATLQIIEIRRQERAEAAADAVRAFENLKRLAKEKDQQIEEERIRLLRGHPKEILKYLPSGLLKDADRQALGMI